MRVLNTNGRSEFYLWEISEVRNSCSVRVLASSSVIVANSIASGVRRRTFASQMWRKVTLTGLVSVVAPGSLVQIIVASTISLCFFGMHARCWPFKDDAANRLKLGCEFALMVSFLCTALLRSVTTKQALIDAGHLQPEAMTSQEQVMPVVLSTMLVVVCTCLPGPSICREECDQLLCVVSLARSHLIIIARLNRWNSDLQPQNRKTQQR